MLSVVVTLLSRHYPPPTLPGFGGFEAKMSPLGRLLLIQTATAFRWRCCSNRPYFPADCLLLLLYVGDTQFSAKVQQHGASQQLTTGTAKVIEY